MPFINKELNRINEILDKNKNVNILNFQKSTKFGKTKYNYEPKIENKSAKKDIVYKKKNISQELFT